MLLRNRKRKTNHPLQSGEQAYQDYAPQTQQEGVEIQQEQQPVNPLPIDIERQYSMDLKKSRFEWFYKLKQRFSKLGVIMEALPFWRNTNTVLAVLSSITLVTATFITISNNYATLQDRVPIIFQQASKSWELLDKELLVVVPIILAALLVLLIKLSSDVYRFDRRLSLMINTTITVFNLMGLLAFYQLLSLSLFY